MKVMKMFSKKIGLALIIGFVHYCSGMQNPNQNNAIQIYQPKQSINNANTSYCYLTKIEDGVYVSANKFAANPYNTISFTPLSREQLGQYQLPIDSRSMVPSHYTATSAMITNIDSRNERLNYRGYTLPQKSNTNEFNQVSFVRDNSLPRDHCFRLNDRLELLPPIMHKTIATCKALISDVIDNRTTEHRLALLTIKIPNKELNNIWEKTRNQLLYVLCDKHGMIQHVTDKNRAAVERIVNNFEEQVAQYQRLHPRIFEEVISENSNDETFNSYRNNVDNQNFIHIQELCSENKFEEAYQIVKQYSDTTLNNKSVNDHMREVDRIASRLYYDRYYINYNSYGISKEFTNDPMYGVVVKDLTKTMVPRATENAYFQKRDCDYKSILQRMNISNPSPAVKSIAYGLVEIQKDGPLQTAQYMSQQFSTNSADADIRNAYKSLYHDNGLPKIFTYSDEAKKIAMPATIHTSEHANERALLFDLATMSPKNAEQELAIKHGIEYVRKACEDASLSESYRSLAQSTCHAMKQQNIEYIYLSYCTQTPLTQAHKEIQILSLPVVARLHKALYRGHTSLQEQNVLIHAIKTMDMLYEKMLEGSVQAEKSLMNIVGTQLITYPVKQADGSQGLKTLLRKPTVQEAVSQVLALERYSQISITSPEIALQRAEALKKYKIEGDARIVSTISLSDASKRFLADHGIYPPKLLTMNANALQKQSQEEFRDITEKTAQQYHCALKEATAIANAANAHLIDIGTEYTIANKIVEAQMVADCCVDILCKTSQYLDGYVNQLPEPARTFFKSQLAVPQAVINSMKYVKPVAKGTVEGVVATAEYIKDHPIEATATALAPEYMAPYHVTKMTLQAMGATYDRLSRIDYKNLNYDRVLAKFNTLYQSLKATPEEEFVRRGTALGVQLVLDGKITNQFNQLAKTAMAKASARVHDIESKLAWAHSVEDAAKTQQKIPVRNSHLAPEVPHGKAEGLEFSVVSDKNNSGKIPTASSGSSGARNILKAHNMHEFFELPFGKSIEKYVRKVKNSDMYEITSDIKGTVLEEKDKIYLDRLHKDHLEVFKANGKMRAVLNLDGSVNKMKTDRAAGRKI
jgi:hypothetical protein